jgi:hypothetical protein
MHQHKPLEARDSTNLCASQNKVRGAGHGANPYCLMKWAGLWHLRDSAALVQALMRALMTKITNTEAFDCWLVQHGLKG